MENKDQLAENLIDKAIAGDQQALEELLGSVRDTVFNLSLRMLGTICDAEDATQEISIKIVTHLSTFRKEALFSTWVYRIALNHLKDCQTHQFANAPFSFEMYGADILDKRALNVPDMSGGVDRSLLESELKLSCTNVMLQCLSTEERCIYVLGTMFKIKSEIAADILAISAAAYRQRLSRTRKTVAAFLKAYCGHSGSSTCSCGRRVNFAIATQRLTPQNLDYLALEEQPSTEKEFIVAMDELDGFSSLFDSLPTYQSTLRTRELLAACMQTDSFNTVMHTKATAIGQ